MLQVTPESADRRTRILDAAEACFVRSGFHRTTMQDVAAEAGMSAGNLYRYFPSKDAIVAGLTERDRRELAGDFLALEGATGADFMAAFAELGRCHFEDGSRDKAVLCLEIWSEATRNPAFARLSAEMSEEVIARLAAVFDRARAAGHIAPTMDSRTVATLICTLADGLFVRRAIMPDFDAAREVEAVMTLIGSLVCGAPAAGMAMPSEECAA